MVSSYPRELRWLWTEGMQPSEEDRTARGMRACGSSPNSRTAQWRQCWPPLTLSWRPSPPLLRVPADLLYWWAERLPSSRRVTATRSIHSSCRENKSTVSWQNHGSQNSGGRALPRAHSASACYVLLHVKTLPHYMIGQKAWWLCYVWNGSLTTCKLWGNANWLGSFWLSFHFVPIPFKLLVDRICQLSVHNWLLNYSDCIVNVCPFGLLTSSKTESRIQNYVTIADNYPAKQSGVWIIMHHSNIQTFFLSVGLGCRVKWVIK